MMPSRSLTASNRLEAFSDGVFAIAVTLLVLDLKVPEDDEGHFFSSLVDQWPTYLAYLAAFSILCLVWLTHHSLFSRIERVNNSLLMRNLIHLFAVSVFSFPTAVLSSALRSGDRDDQITAIGLFSLCSIALSLSYAYLCRVLITSPEVAREAADVEWAKTQTGPNLLGALPPVVAFGCAFISPGLAVAVLLANPVIYLLILLRGERRNGNADEQPSTP